MKTKSAATWVALIIAGTVLSGCGLYVPQKDLLHPNDIDPRNRMSRYGKTESNIIANIRCEITKGVYRAVSTGNVPWLVGWGATISLNLTWEEESKFNPNTLYTTPFSPKPDIFSLSVGLNTSAKATRNESITFTLENKTLLQEAMLTIKNNPNLDCSLLQGGVTVESDLKIDEFIYDKASIAGGHEARTQPIKFTQFSTFQEKLTFVVSIGGNLTPSLRLLRFSVNSDGPFLEGSRAKTSEIIITLGPIVSPGTAAKPAELALQAAVQHQAAIFGSSTASSILSQSR